LGRMKIEFPFPTHPLAACNQLSSGNSQQRPLPGCQNGDWTLHPYARPSLLPLSGFEEGRAPTAGHQPNAHLQTPQPVGTAASPTGSAPATSARRAARASCSTASTASTLLRSSGVPHSATPSSSTWEAAPRGGAPGARRAAGSGPAPPAAASDWTCRWTPDSPELDGSQSHLTDRVSSHGLVDRCHRLARQVAIPPD